jgi:hypothetical protein
MPRIYNSASEPLDFCKGCFPPEDEAIELYGNCFGYECEHPLYGGEEYDCEVCKKRLTNDDN